MQLSQISRSRPIEVSCPASGFYGPLSRISKKVYFEPMSYPFSLWWKYFQFHIKMAILLNAQVIGSTLKISFALSKWPYLHRANLVSSPYNCLRRELWNCFLDIIKTSRKKAILTRFPPSLLGLVFWHCMSHHVGSILNGWIIQLIFSISPSCHFNFCNLFAHYNPYTLCKKNPTYSREKNYKYPYYWNRVTLSEPNLS